MYYRVELDNGVWYTIDSAERDKTYTAEGERLLHMTPDVYSHTLHSVNHNSVIDVDAVYMIAINVVGVVVRHLSGMGRRDMYAIDNAIRATYVRIYAGVTPSDAVRRIDNVDCQDMIDTAISAIIDAIPLWYNQSQPMSYYDTIVRPAYRAVNALVWNERKQAHASIDSVVTLAVTSDDQERYIGIHTRQWLMHARYGKIDTPVARMVNTLTSIQYDILCDLCMGLSYRTIAQRRSRTLPTIQSHVQALRRIFAPVLTIKG
jgi:hypothetical protein